MTPEHVEELLKGPVERAPRLRVRRSAVRGVPMIAAALVACGLVLFLIVRPSSRPAIQDPKDAIRELVYGLKDGNEHVTANNVIVEKLVKHGADSIAPLVAAIVDADFKGRAYAAWAIANVLEVAREKDGRGMLTLVACLGDDDAVVRLLAASGLSRLKDRRTVFALVENYDPALGSFAAALSAITGESRDDRASWLVWWNENKAAHPDQVIEDGEKLARRLRDGNDHLERNNRIVDRLAARGTRSVDPLARAVQDRKFGGRGYAAWALTEVLKDASDDGDRGVTAVLECLSDSDEYVRVLSSSGLRVLRNRRTVHELIRNFDPKNHTGEALRAITGEAFDSREEWLAWWEANRSKYPSQIVLKKEKP